ncbi:MAG: hypothetical protein LRY46_00045 [Candidatus Pacebacteria bacterium]|nr:hypothetical protein [Candidatus Paceibacterota bacterium]
MKYRQGRLLAQQLFQYADLLDMGVHESSHLIESFTHSIIARRADNTKLIVRMHFYKFCMTSGNKEGAGRVDAWHAFMSHAMFEVWYIC